MGLPPPLLSLICSLSVATFCKVLDCVSAWVDRNADSRDTRHRVAF